MSIEGQTYGQNEGEEKTNPVWEALLDAGLADVAEAPRVGTKAYERLIDAAVKYMEDVRKAAHSGVPTMDPTYDSSDDYYSSKKNKISNPALTDSAIRRQHHDAIARMLLSKSRTELSKTDADKISDFAAYVTGNEDYVGTW